MPVLYKLLSGFLLVILATATLGGYAVYSVSDMGAVAIEMYNRPLMAINFSRAASTDFAQIDAAISRLPKQETKVEATDVSKPKPTAEPISERQRLLRIAAGLKPVTAEPAAPAAPAVIETNEKGATDPAEKPEAEMTEFESQSAVQVALIEEYLENFADDIEVAHERAMSDESRALAERVMKLAEEWQSVNAALLGGDYSVAPQGREILDEIETGLSDLVEAAAGAGFEFLVATEERLEHDRIITIIVLGAALLLAIATVIVLNHVIVRPLRRATTALHALSEGDTSVAFNVRSKDEIGAISSAIQVFRDKLLSMAQMETKQAETEARAEAEKREAINSMLGNFEQRVRGVVETVAAEATELQRTAQHMSDDAKRAEDQSTSVAESSETMAGEVQTVAAATEELSSTVEEISRQASQSSDVANEAVKQIEVTNSTVRGLDEAGQKIGTVVNTISDIAEQTNLLALNATIEAARAGDAGKGFAVVANEVKNLANQTASATQEVSVQISEMQTVTDEAIAAIRAIGQVIDKTSEIATTISATVDEQGAATREIATSISNTVEGTRGVSTGIEQVRGVVQETGASAGQVLVSAKQLLESSNSLRSEVARFVDDVRQESGVSTAA